MTVVAIVGADTAKFSLFNGVFCYSAMAAVSYARSPRSVQCSAQASQRTSLQRDMGTLCAGGDENRLPSVQLWLRFHPIAAAINAHEGCVQTTIICLMTTCLRCATRAFFTDVCKQAHAVPASRTRALLTVPVTIAISACPPPQRRRRVLFNFCRGYPTPSASFEKSEKLILRTSPYLADPHCASRAASNDVQVSGHGLRDSPRFTRTYPPHKA